MNYIKDLLNYLFFLFCIAAMLVGVFFLSIIIKEYSYLLSVDVDFSEVDMFKLR